MAGRPYWSGQIRISLVAFPVTLSSALRRGSSIPLHEIDRNTGERIHHRNVNEDGEEVDRADIVKGFQTEDKDHIIIDEDEIDAIKLPSSNTLELVTFAPLDDISVMRFERPYYVLPDGRDAGEIYAVIHKVLRDNGKAGIGQITMRGREELCALLSSPDGLLLETLRYNAELVEPQEILPDLGDKKLRGDYVTLASQLIEKNTHGPRFDEFHDHYHEALRELIEAKKAHRKPRLPKAAPPGKIIDFADALRKSLEASAGGPASHGASRRRRA